MEIRGQGNRPEIGHAAASEQRSAQNQPMWTRWILLCLFLIVRRCTGWLGVDLLPAGLLDRSTTWKACAGVLAASAPFRPVGRILLSAVLRRPTDAARCGDAPPTCCEPGPVGLGSWGLLVANLAAGPDSSVCRSLGVNFREALAAVLSKRLFGVLGYNWPRCTDAPCCPVQPREHRRPCWCRRGVEPRRPKILVHQR